MKDKLFAAYVQALTSKVGTGYFMTDSLVAPEETARKMFAAIQKGKRSQWMKYNQCLKEAARSLGIKSDPELRAIVQSE